MTVASTPGPVTFVLSGGASLGAIQVGMLRALVDRGIDVVVLPPPCPLDAQPMDLGHAETLMSRAEADALAELPPAS